MAKQKDDKKTVRLFNRGKRTISVEVGVDPLTGKTITKGFGPNKGGTFPIETANKLRRLYKGEVQSLDDVVEDFDKFTAEPEKPMPVIRDTFEDGVQTDPEPADPVAEGELTNE